MSIIAGDVFWRIGGDTKGLEEAMSKARNAVGVAMTAAGAAITTFAYKSVTSFANTADELAKMSQRTGFSISALSELKFAAEQSGTSIEGIEKASRNLSSVIVDASAGNEQYQQTIAALGLSWQTLGSLSPEEQFLQIGFALADVEDATLRTSMASDLFGARMGTQLLPMLNSGSAGLQAMRDHAVKLGLSIGPEQAAQAELFNDTMDQMKAALGSLSRDVAITLIPILTDLMIYIRDTATNFRAWRAEHPGLTEAITKLVLAAGAIMTVLGPLLIMLPGIATAFSAISAAIPIVGAVLLALTGPVGIVIGAIGLLIAAAWYFVDDWGLVWEAVKSTVRGAAEFIVWVLQPVFDLIGGLMDLGRGIGDVVGSAIYGGSPVGLATGGTVTGGGWAMVGERGPELVQMPRGATVYDAGQTAGAMQGAASGNVYNLNFGRDSVRSDDDIRYIERSLARMLEGDLLAMGVRA